MSLDKNIVHAFLSLPGQQLRRAIEPKPDGWRIVDECVDTDGRLIDFTVRWQFAPGSNLKRIAPRRYLLKRQDVQVEIHVSDAWAEVELVELDGEASALAGRKEVLDGMVSPGFRQTTRAPFLRLVARAGAGKPPFATAFLA